jgi:hypothetical protein
MKPHPRCLIPLFDGAILSQEWREALWDKFVAEAPCTADRQWFAQRTMRGDARRQSCNTAIASFTGGAEPGSGYQPEDGCQVAETADSRG